MSMESAIERLAYAIEQHSSSSAVQEIIRQRDAAKHESFQLMQQRDRWINIADERSAALITANRKAAALRGVITRMRKSKEVSQ